jgi:hypothetical protein
MRGRRLLHGPLLLLLYQAVPACVQRDSLGRYRLTVGFGAGQWENERFDCSGNLVSAVRVPYRTGGVQLDAWPAPRLRVTGFGGAFHQTPDSLDFNVRDYYGTFAGGQVAFEGQHVGIGLGAMHVPGRDGFTAPVPYLRIGNIDGAYFRADGFPPTPALSATGWVRMGVGFHEGHRRVPSGFVGLALPPLYGNKAMLTAYAQLPLARHVAVHVGGIIGPGERYSQRGASIGMRYDFGLPSRSSAH